MGSGQSRGAYDFPADVFISKGNVLDVEDTGDSLICFVTKKFNMDGRFNKVFKSRFGSLVWLKNQDKNTGEIAVLIQNNRYIYYTIVKDGNHKKATTTDLRTGLDAVVSHAVSNGVSTIRMPDEVFSEITKPELVIEADAAFNGSGVTHVISSESLLV